MYNDPYKHENELREIREQIAKSGRENIVAAILFVFACIGILALVVLLMIKYGNLPK